MRHFKKGFIASCALLVGLTVIAGCSNRSKTADSGVIDKLTVGFVPSRDPAQIVTATEPLKKLLKDQLEKEGVKVNNVDIQVGTDFNAVGEGLKAGTIDVGFIPAGTYVLYRGDADVVLTATRKGLSVTSNDPSEWNKNKPTQQVDQQVTSYVGLMIAGPSEKGKATAEKVNAGQKLSWEDISSMKWGVSNSTTSSAGYLYPTLWFNENYQKTIKDLGNNAIIGQYADSFGRLATGQVDALLIYGDGRLDYAQKWTENFNRSASIWEETNVIGVTSPIFNDTISVSKKSKNVNDTFKTALQKAMIEIAKTDEGKEVIKIYNHEGYQVANDSDYDNEAKVQEIIKSLR